MEKVIPRQSPQPNYFNSEKKTSQKDPWVIILLTFLGAVVLGGGSYLAISNFDTGSDGTPPITSDTTFKILQRQSSCAQEDGKNMIQASIQNNGASSLFFDESATVTLDGYEVNSFYKGEVKSGEVVKLFEDDCSSSPIGFCYEGPHKVKITFKGSTEELEINCPAIIPTNETDDNETELVLGSPLTKMASFTKYNAPFASTISEDGQALYRSGGTFIQKLDINPLQTQNPPTIEEIILAETKIYSSTLDMESAYDSLYVCSGDLGLHVTDEDLAAAPELIDIHPRELWCMSLATASFEGTDVILALWAGLDDNELRVYDSADNSILASVRMNTGTGITEEGIGWDVEADGRHAYMALGTAGIARVDWKSAIDSNDPQLLQGPLSITDSSFDRKTKELLRVRDISISDGFLFAAASAQGLIEIDLSNPWSKTMSTKAYLQENTIVNQYPIRVNALKDSIVGSNMVFAQSVKHPRSFDWGPHVMYGAWDWESSNPSGDLSDLDDDKHTYKENGLQGLLVFEKRNSDVPLREVAQGEFNDLETITFHQVGENMFGYTELPGIYTVFRNNGQVQTPLFYHDEGFIQGRGGYIEGTMSLIQTDTIIGMSDAGNHAFQKLSGNPPTFSIVPNTLDDEHNIGVFSGTRWKTGSNKEFVIAGGAGEIWPLLELTWENGFPTISRWKIPVNLEGETDQYGYDSRSYSDADYDPETGLVVLVRSQSKDGGIIMDSQNIYDMAKAIAQGQPVYPDILTTFITHDEAPNNPSNPNNLDGEILYTLSSTFFKNSAGDKMVAIAAGANVDPSSSKFRNPKGVLVSIPDPFVPGEPLQTITFHGVNNPSAAVDAQVFDFEGEQMLVLAGEGGDISLHNIDEVPEILTGEVSDSALNRVAEWHMRDQPLDGRKTMATDLVIRNELVNEEQVTRIYVASNNEGIYVLEVRKSGSNWQLQEITRMNTIYQTVGISLEKVDGEDVLVAYDHFGGMVAFTAE